MLLLQSNDVLIFKPLFEVKKVQIYLDDIMIATATVDENLKILKEALCLLT